MFKDALTRIKRNPFTSASAIIIISAASLIFGIFAVLLMNLNEFSRTVGEQVYLEAYLKSGTSPEKGQFLADAATRIEGVERARYVSNSEAVERLAETDAAVEMLSDMELLGLVPSSIEIYVTSPAAIDNVHAIVFGYEDVESIRYGGEVVARMAELIEAVKDFCKLLFIVLAACTICVIATAISISVFSEKKNIRIMRLLGADNRFILKPFLAEGIIMGAAGGAISFFLLRLFYGAAFLKTLFGVLTLSLLPAYPTVYLCGGIVILCGITLGAIGSVISVKYFLDRKSED